ncbi:MAG: TorF family putative porin [Pseudomonadota bacterium]
MKKNMTTNITLAAALAFSLTTWGGLAQAQEAAPAPLAAEAKPEAKPDHEVTYNLALTSDYRYRGVSQTRLKPALQGGADYTYNPSGLYAGVWLSTIKWTKDAGGDGDVEMDIYGGKRGELAKDISYDVGGLGYVYPSNGLNPSANTFELYGQLAFGPFYAKYSHSLSNLFAAPDSKNSAYLDLGFNHDVYAGYVLNLHVGHQNVKNNGDFSYSDYKVGVTKDFGFATVALAAVYANTDAYVGRGKNLGKTGAVLTVTKTF